MITAAEVRENVEGAEKIFEENANTLAEYFVEEVADELAKSMIHERKTKSVKEYQPREIYEPALRKCRLWEKYATDHTELMKRARQIANAAIHEAGFEGGFSEETHGEPMYGGGSGRYNVVVLSLEC